MVKPNNFPLNSIDAFAMIQNKWLEIALYPGCIQGFFLVYLLWQKKNANREAIQYFNALLLTISILMLLRVTYQPSFFREFAEIILLPDVILFLTGPFIYLFTRALLRVDALPRFKLWSHFIPAGIHVLLVNSFLGLHLKGVLHILTLPQILVSFNLIELAAMLSLGIYLWMSLRIYHRYRAAFYQKFAAPFIGQFLRSFLIVCLGLLIFWGAGLVHKIYQHQSDYSIYTLFWVLLVVAIYFLALNIWSTPAILELPVVIEEEAEKMTQEEPIPAIELEALSQYMLSEKPYLYPEIKIGDLAEALDQPKHRLSKIINQGYNRNFFDFINGYRVQAYIQARRDQRFSHLNTLELAFATGFNSKSAFNRAFLKETGQNPREYFGVKESNML